MAQQLLELAKTTITTTSVAIITVPANQIWEVQNIFVAQPSTGVAKEVVIGRGTLTTAADTDGIIRRNWAAGIQSENIYAPIALIAAATLDVIASLGTGEATVAVYGYKTLLT